MKEWISENILYILIGIVILYWIIRYKIIASIKRKKIKEQPITSSLATETLFGVAPNLTENLDEMGKNTIVKLRETKALGKGVTKEEAELEKYYKQQKSIIAYRKKNLCLEFSRGKNQLNLLNQMVENNRKMEEIKKGGGK